MAAALGDIIAFLDALLEPRRFDDYGPNGLQVPGPESVAMVVTGVSAHGELIERAIGEHGADLILVHHGLFWRGQPLQLTPLMHDRLAPLFAAGVALAAYHLPLDAHPRHGNNALLAAALELSDVAPLGELGMQGTLAQPLAPRAFAERVASAVGGREPLLIAGGDHSCGKVGIVSGAGTDFVFDALAAGCDTFVTGEPSERAYGIAKDAGIHYLAAGHHATETFGVRALGDLLATEFGIAHRFVDVVNPI